MLALVSSGAEDWAQKKVSGTGKLPMAIALTDEQSERADVWLVARVRKG